MKIRLATLNDLDLLIEGLEDIRRYEKYQDIHAKKKDILDYRRAINNKNVRVIEIDGEPVGFLYYKIDFKLMYINESFLWVQRIYVREKFRGRGLARVLYDDAAKIARERGLKNIFCDVYKVNKNSQKVHKKLGFKPIYAIYRKEI